MTELYVVIGILLLIIFVLFFMVVKLLRINSEKDADHSRRNIIAEQQGRAGNRYLMLLLLETKGIKTGVKAMADLYHQFIGEIGEDQNFEKFAKNLTNNAKKGEE